MVEVVIATEAALAVTDAKSKQYLPKGSIPFKSVLRTRVNSEKLRVTYSSQQAVPVAY